ncbi:helix-turn-helix transcriptional regulator [Micromonospora haikouensis]|uniref:helix-turn-helix transcriptional regulator n=1 Tax=Micromonospora haikouensis TaxID=686309 RepID=UPI0033C80CC1
MWSAIRRLAGAAQARPSPAGTLPGAGRGGSVVKGPSWYLVANTEVGRRTFRIDRVSSADPTGDPVHRPEDFDLAESWRAIADEVDRKRRPIEARAVCAPHGTGVLRMGFGGRLEVGGSTADGRIEVVIRGNDEHTSEQLGHSHHHPHPRHLPERYEEDAPRRRRSRRREDPAAAAQNRVAARVPPSAGRCRLG